MPDFQRRDKTGLYHIAHEEVANPSCTLAVSLVAFPRFGIFWMGQSDRADFFKNIEYRYSVLTSRSHTDFNTVVSCEPLKEFAEVL